MNSFSNSSVKNGIDDSDEEINIKDVISKYLRYWKWFIISVLFFLILGTLVYLISKREYEITTSVLLKENKGSGAQKGNPLGNLEELGLLSTTNNIDNEIAVFSSPNLMKQIVLSLELQTSYFQNGIFRQTEVYKDCPYYARLENIKPDDLQGSISIKIEKDGSDKYLIKGTYKVKKEENKLEATLEKLPGFVELPANLGKLYITLRPNTNDELLEKSYTIDIYNAQAAAYAYVKDLTVNSTTKSSSVLAIKLKTQNVSKGIDILNEMVKIYNSNNVKENNEMAQNTSLFIEERLKDISGELSDVEDDVVSYKKRQGITDLSSEAKIYVEQTSQIEQKRIDIETQLKTVDLVENFIQKPDNNYKLIPNLGITDPGLAEVISEYNTSLLAYQRLERSTSEDNPVRTRALDELSSTRMNILGAISNVKRALNISKLEIDKQGAQLSSRIYTVPTQERGLLEVTRQQQVKQALYLYLMQVREETSITMASTSDKAKVITDPIIPQAPVSPKRNIIYLLSLLLGIIIPVAVIYVKDLLQTNISSREELEEMAKPSVIGEIQKKEEPESIVVVKDKTTPIVELFRSLRNNIKFIINNSNKKTILVTSTIPGEGKTFICINLAASFSLSDNKVLLIGMDIRNPQLAANMNFKKGNGLTTYLSGNTSNWKELLVNLKEYPNLDILQAGPVPPNPNELLMKPAVKQLIDEARKTYDIIIIDSAPVGVISDTFLLNSVVDTTVYVTREDVTPKGAVSFINEVYTENRLPCIYLVINGVDPSNIGSKYGSKYGYGYGIAKKDF